MWCQGTRFIKNHTATECALNDLADNQIRDVANFMGHAIDIHNNIYRRPVEKRDVLQMSQILEESLETNERDEQLSDESSEIEDCNLPLDSDSEDYTPKQKKRKHGEGLTRICGLKTPWTKREKLAVIKNFEECIREDKLPSMEQLLVKLAVLKELKHRSPTFFKVMHHNELQRKRNSSSYKDNTLPSNAECAIAIENCREFQHLTVAALNPPLLTCGLKVHPHYAIGQCRSANPIPNRAWSYNTYTKKRNITETDLCECGEQGTPEHITFNCTLNNEWTTELRQSLQDILYKKCSEMNISLTYLIQLTNMITIKAMEEYIIKRRTNSRIPGGTPPDAGINHNMLCGFAGRPSGMPIRTRLLSVFMKGSRADGSSVDVFVINDTDIHHFWYSRKCDMEWTNTNVINLIDMYRDRTVLWDCRLLDYKNKNKRNDAFLEISVSFGMEKIEIE
ncbi:hypothetical protein FQR65_LT19682 [Abscondita terminalis]|nr:hypothetical protein FQR65_LT19682 [Abscondita terminalis]